MGEYDIAVVGAGVAGLTAARHAAAGGASVVVLDRMGVGGQVATVEGITNFPGYSEPIAGFDLGAHLMEEAEDAGAEVTLAEVTGIDEAENGFVLAGVDEEGLRARTIIVAAGSTRRPLSVPGEVALDGRGVSHCASCDGPFFRDGRLIVVGGGDSALDEARILAGFANEVLVVHDGPELTAAPVIAERTAEHTNIRNRARATVSAIHGPDRVESVTVRDLDTGTEADETAAGVFIYIGLAPNAGWLTEFLDLTGTGHLAVGPDLSTSRPGVYAAGDIREGSAAMLDEAVTDGQQAAKAALARLAVSA